MENESVSKDQIQLEALEETIKKNSVENSSSDFLEKYVEEIKNSLPTNENSLYANCIREICYMPLPFRCNYNTEALKICLYYLKQARGELFNSTKYHVSYRKRNIKQLNIDLTPDEKENFKEATTKNGTTMKKVVKDFILQYIEKNK